MADLCTIIGSNDPSSIGFDGLLEEYIARVTSHQRAGQLKKDGIIAEVLEDGYISPREAIEKLGLAPEKWIEIGGKSSTPITDIFFVRNGEYEDPQCPNGYTPSTPDSWKAKALYLLSLGFGPWFGPCYVNNEEITLNQFIQAMNRFCASFQSRITE